MSVVMGINGISNSKPKAKLLIALIVFYSAIFSISFSQAKPSKVYPQSLYEYEKPSLKNIIPDYSADSSSPALNNILPQASPIPSPIPQPAVSYNDDNISYYQKNLTSSINKQLCLIMDSSGSIGSFDWDVMCRGIASTIDGKDSNGVYHPEKISVVHDGSLELSVVVFSSDAYIQVFTEGKNPIITESNYKSIADQIRAIPWEGWGTQLELALEQAKIVISGSPNYNDASIRVVNIITDGVTWYPSLAEGEQKKLIPVLAKNGAYAEIDVEGIGYVDDTWLATYMTYPESLLTVPDNIFTVSEEITVHGFLLYVSTFSDFEIAFRKKLNFIFVTPTPSPTPYIIYRDWINIPASEKPKVRYESAFQFDPSTNKMILFGGHGGSAWGRLYDTWEYQKPFWTFATTANDPNSHPLGSGPGCFAYDSEYQRFIYFGGYNETSYLNDTWQFTGGEWMIIPTDNAPTKRYAASMVYDPERKKIVLFGGYGVSPVNPLLYILLNDTWEFDGFDWKKISVANSPEARSYHSMVYDSKRKKILLFGGKNVDNSLWQYNGTTWEKLATANNPPERYSHAMVYHPRYDLIIMYGGYNFGIYYDETWILKDNIWEKAYTQRSPEHPFQGSMIYNSYDSSVYYFGGRNEHDDVSNEIYYYYDQTFFKINGYMLH